MIDGDGELWLIDWDEVIRAPKERDLMFVVGGISTSLIQPHETEWFFEGYGETDGRSAGALLLPVRVGGAGHRLVR